MEWDGGREPRGCKMCVGRGRWAKADQDGKEERERNIQDFERSSSFYRKRKGGWIKSMQHAFVGVALLCG